MIYGEPGVGKTSWCSQITGHYFLATEAGTGGVSIFGHNVGSWVEFMSSCVELKKAKDANFEGQRVIDTIIIDSYDVLWEYCASYIMANETFIVKGRPERFTRVEDVEFGKAYKRVNQEVISTLRKLRLLGYGIILIARYKEKTIKWQGQELTGHGLNASESVQNAIVSECDAVGYFMTEERVSKNEKNEVVAVETGRWAYWQPSFSRVAKHRLEGFPERLPLPINTGWQLYEDTFREYAAKKAVKPRV